MGAGRVVRDLYRSRCGHHVQRDDLISSDQCLVGAKSESIHDLVLPDQLLPVPDGDLSTRCHRLGTVGLFQFCSSCIGRSECAGQDIGPTAAWIGWRTLGELANRAAFYNGAGQLVGVAASIPVGFIELSKREQLGRCQQARGGVRVSSASVRGA